MKNQIFSLAANEEQGRAGLADYIYCVSATGKIQVLINGKAQVTLESGQGFRLPNSFDKFAVKDKSGAPNTVDLLVGQGDFDNGNLSGSVGATIEQGSTLSQSAVTVTTTATALTTLDTTRKFLSIQNTGAADVFVGGSGVTIANGHKIPSDGVFVIDQASAAAWFAIVAASTNEVRILASV